MKTLGFEGKGSEYFGIWIVNILLTILTLGLFYPWAKVRTNRYFYANTLLEGRNFEYHATGKQLFVGYLIAILLFVIYIVLSEISVAGSFAVLGIFFLGLPWIIWRSIKFNLSMTSFSNVRFSFDGALGDAYINFLALPIAFFLAIYAGPILLAVGVPALGAESFSFILGLVSFIIFIGFMVLALFLYAYMRKRNTAYSLDNAHFGQGNFVTDLSTKAFVKIFLKALGLNIGLGLALLLILSILVYMTIGLGGLLEIQQGLDNPDEAGAQIGSALAMVIFPLYLGLIFVGVFSYAYTYTRIRSYVYSNLSLDEDISFNSTLKARTMAWVLASNFILVIITLGLGAPWARVRMVRMLVSNTEVDTEAGFEQYISQKQEEQSSLGEQIGDAFDVEIGVAI